MADMTFPFQCLVSNLIAFVEHKSNMQNHSFSNIQIQISNPTAFGYLRWMQSFDAGRDTRNALRSRMPEHAVVTSLAQPLMYSLNFSEILSR
jgi:hypothetical protein